MLLSEIKPYTNNARNNEKAVSAVAESIKKFGFRGQILLISREDPTIVNGHTRVKALQYLGCSKLDDKHIAFADDLTEDEIKALRLADNKVAQIATWNRTKLRNEVNALNKKGIDMSKFNFNFKSKEKLYGAERLRTDDYYNLNIVDDSYCDRKGMPKLKACNQLPKEILPFNYAKSCYEREKWIHFFIDDYQFERLWNTPDKYIELLKSYDGVSLQTLACIWICRCRCNNLMNTGAGH